MSGNMAVRIAKRFVSLPLEQRRQFLAKLREDGKDFSLLPVVESRHDFASIPLSFAQQRLLFLWQLEPHSAAYNMAAGLRLSGRLDVSALQRSFDYLATRHEALRTVFQVEGEQPRQVILDHLAVPLEQVDLTAIATDQREAELATRVREASHQSFDLLHGPLLRATLYRLAAEDYVLLVCMHHIVSDGWSMDVMVKEFVHSYQAFSQGQAPQLPALAVQYADYAIWQRSWLEAGEGERQLDYWRQQLGEEQPLLEVAADYPRPLAQSFDGQTLGFDFGVELSRRLGGYARAQGMTLFMLVLTGFSLFLSRQAGQRDIRIGVPNANRGRAEVEGLIGFFVNTQVLRCQVDERLSFDDLLAQVREAVLGAQAHQELPFEQLVDALVPERNLGHNPLFQVKFNQNVGMQRQRSLALPGLSVAEYPLDKVGTHFDLALDITDDGQLIHGEMTFASDLYQRSTVEAFIPAFIELLGLLLDAPQLPLHRLAAPLRSEQAPQREVPALVLEHWQQQVHRQPEALAACSLEHSLSFAALDQAANRLAHHLQQQGVVSGQPVAVLMERSLDWLTCMLGILKAGAVYMPLDTKAPETRLRQMLDAAQAKVLLCAAGDARLASLAAADRLTLAYVPEQWQDLPANAPALTLWAESPAYVIHTSGSTGQPKGVLVSHGALASYVAGLLERLAPAPGASMALVSTIAADLGYTVLFGALCSGCLLHVLPEALGFDPDAFARYMAEHQVGVLKIVPGHLAALLQAGNPADVLPEHALIVGGEACTPALVEQVRRLKPGCRLINHYGPSETTVGVLTHEVAALAEGARAVPVGEPLPGAHVLLLDDVLNPVADQVAGELYIGGASVAQGYLGQPGLTAERFLPDPTRPGQRLYRSGDRVRRNRSGQVEFIGRADDQVKVRGYRVEPAEVGRVLRGLDGVAEAVVLAQPVEGDESRLQLVGWCVGQELQGEALRQQLQDRLPDYMVPAQILVLDRLPLTANGKLDKRALPAPGVARRQYTAPVGEIEEALAAIWAEVLKLDQVGSTDNFFELGGDSILSLQIIARAKRQGIKLSPKQLFEKQTIGQLAAVAKRIEKKAVAVEQVSGSMPLLPIQARFFETAIPERQHWNQALLLKPTQALGADHLQGALQALVAQHDALRLRFTQGEAWQAEFQPTKADDILWVRQLSDLAELPALAEQAQRSLDLAQGPLLRALLVELPEGQQRLLLVIHHLVVDGVSWRVLLEDLQLAYTALAAGKAVTLAAKSSSLKAWAERLGAYVRSPELLAEAEHWLRGLEAAGGELPCDNPAGAQTTRHVAHASSRLDATLTRKLLQVAPAAYRTQVNDLLLAALSRVLCDWTREDSVLIQLEGHGREDLFPELDLSRTVGWFSSLFPVRLAPAQGLGEGLCAIKEQLRSVPNKGIGYGVLRYLGEPDLRERLAALPQPRVTFNYLGQFDGSFAEVEGALFTPASEGSGATQDLDSPLGNWLGINGQVYQGELELDWSFSREVFHPGTIEALARRYEQVLAELVEHCAQAPHQGVTPSDFPLAELTQAQLDSLPLAAGDIEDLYPLSPMQQGMLFHSLYEQDAGNYINQLRVNVQGLDVARFRAAWQAVVDNHEVLRSCFPQDLPLPVQVVRRQVQVPFVELGQAQDLDAVAQAERQAGFDLASGPLLRLTLIRTADGGHHLIYTSHHILMDGWSSSRLLGEVLQRYSGVAPSARTSRYRDYIQWLQGQDQQASETFWRAQVAELDEPTRLVQAFKSSAQGRGHGSLALRFEPQQTQQLADFAREQRVTLNTLVQAAWLLLLQRYTGQASVAFGATVAGRPAELAGVEEQLGLFINTLPVVASPRPEQTVGDWVQQVQALNLALREHEHTPLYEIQRWAGWSGEALFDNILVFENYPVAEALQQGAPQGLQFGEVQNQEQTNYPLTLVVQVGERLEASFSFDRQCFSELAIDQLAGHFQHLLAQLAADGQRALGALSLPVEDQQVVASYPSTTCTQELIEAQAARTPEAIAVTFAGQALSYDQLNRRANCLAHKLRAQGVGPDVLVGIAVERGFEMIVGLLAILKAGGAYVPLDPEYPQDRLSYMMEDSGIALLLTQGHLLGGLPVPAHVRSLSLEDDLAGYSDENLEHLTQPDNLAYVIYTSGSTGKPKGTLLPHHNLLRLFKATDAWFGFGPQDVWTLFHSYAFDFSVWEIFGALLHGGRLVIVPRETTRSPEDFHQLLVEQGVTVLNQTPSAFKPLMRVVCDSASDLSLRYVIFGGEALDVAALQPWFERFGEGCDNLINMYGITETTVHVTYRPIRFADTQQAGSPIGAAIPDLSMYVLDADFNPVAKGCTGELHVGHAGLARGYHNRASLTAERFVPDPFSSEGGRLYRTGDLARYREQGVIEYVGRIDHQVKIRGFRIELGEIEARLQEHAAVREVLVLDIDGAGGKQLAAYLIAQDANADHATLRDTLKQHLKANLPDYMVPTHFLVLDQWPLTANGKLDRKALPKPDASQLQQGYVAPRTALEQQLAAIWAEVLKVEQVGLHDNFFELGGHSLLATQVTSRIRQRLNVEVSLRILFESADLQTFAQAAGQGAASQAPAFTVVDRNQPLALSYAQQRQWFLWQLEPASAAYNIPSALRLQGELDIEALRSSFAALIARHETLRTTFRQQGDSAEQVVHARLETPLDITTAALDEAGVQAWVETQVRQPFDLQHGPLLRARLLRLAADEHVLVLVLHHIVADGWSMPILVDELVRGYESHLHGQAPQLPALAFQYADYAAWQRQWMEAGEQQRQLDYWQARLGSTQPILELATDRPRPVVQQYEGARLPVDLEPSLVAQLKTLAGQHDVTLFMLLLASFQALLHRHSGQSDIRVGVPVANRTRAETEGLIGFFVNTQVLDARFQPQIRFDELLQQVKHTALGAQAHQELPFEQLVEALQPERSLSHSPLFQVMFNHQTQVLGESRVLAGLSLQGLVSDKQTAQFDLTLDTAEHEGGLSATLTYATSLFEPATVARMAEHWRNLLQGICQDAGQRVAELPLLSREERERTLYAWNDSAADYPRGQTVQQLIEAQAARTPQAVAAVLGEQSLSYAQLNQRANALAHHLRSLGVGPDVLVGIAVERSLDMLVGLLAVLKAGGAYVPLDPQFPEDRLAYMMEDSGIALLLTQSSLVQRLPVPPQVRCLCLDQAQPGEYSQDNPRPLAHPENLAYVIYTSGSTGKPKGVTIRHDALVNFLCSMARQPGIDAHDKVLSLTSLSFDIAGLELYLPLLRGACVVLLGEQVNKDPQALLAVIQARAVSVVQATPSTWRMLLDAAAPGAFAGKKVLCGGEALSAELAQRLIAQAGHVWNVYGPTETTIWSACHYLTDSDDVWLGRPLANTRLHVLSDELDVLPQGARGELLIGGDGLARGYHNRPGLTAERFVPDPFASEPGARLYRTGDLTRYREDGVIEYVGRLDHQVKIRGFRIELGEIEERLLLHPAIREAAVIDINGPAGKQLAAYLVLHDAQQSVEALRGELRAHLKAGLPDYMVPNHLVGLARMPQTPNGKLDRKALPLPDASQLQAAHVAPVTELERKLAAIWAEVLQVERVGLQDNFFDLGGHSLLIVQVIGRVREQLGVDLSLNELFEQATLADFSQVVERKSGQVANAHDELTKSLEALKRLTAQEIDNLIA
ncbi:non-ribosomal peptide synthetase [Pseudomonas sp. RC3H12]|uniref:non-ribosomal peptide synthetase n=1 Tax=Pseudomonas sp. RC3H12 TaxID=2834406 RepID=UPI001BDDF6F2|nr:non-ribosomal peptide synthetase [Pseudomonas sp. RC3H12]QWA30646.1 amino acid adenylation domain-containing protein [Pseudomonas sp. RC3H12]